MSKLSVNNSGFYLEGKPFRIISGTIHYFRVVPEYWEDRLKKLKECGMNAVETYTCWNLHERKEGHFNFEGMLNLPAFLETAKALGLFVVLRPGPYSCGEWEKGALPSWLETVPGLELRCYNKPFLEKISNYFKKLFDVVRPYLAENGGPVIAVQVENEYGSFGDDHDYMKAVKDIIVANGVKELLFTSDGPGYFMLNGGSIPDTLATVNFGSNPKDNFAKLKRFRPDSPLMCTEYWNGWFDHWYEEHHTRDSADTAAVMKEMLLMGASVNMYMFHGGTNFGFYNGANYDGFYQPTVTSYDYNCPVSESGDLTEKFYEVRDAIAEVTGNKPELTVSDSKKTAYGKLIPVESARLFDNLEFLSGGKTVKSRVPLSFEELGCDFGYVLYQSVLSGPFEELELSIDGLNDRASVYADGKLLGIKENTGHRDDKITFGLDFNETADFKILTENMGRVNYGSHIKDLKGITGGVRFANCYHFGWENIALTLDDISGLEWKKAGDKAADKEKNFTPTFFKYKLDVKEKADTFIKPEAFHKGCIFVNGFNISRYWNDEGPQKTIYITAPLLKEGVNEIVVFETDKADEGGLPHVTFTDKEDLG
ncbi:MAG: beta-galactosidase [Lachnospiraceae bacterium]|nr:beta-galactosidase [Lachnospiraceae bacterium]